MNTEQQRDDDLWQMAKARVNFRRSLISYFIFNAFLVAIWFFTGGIGSYFWPVWSIMGWGVVMAFEYYHAFHGNKNISAQQEYERLKREQENKNQ